MEDTLADQAAALRAGQIVEDILKRGAPGQPLIPPKQQQHGGGQGFGGGKRGRRRRRGRGRNNPPYGGGGGGGGGGQQQQHQQHQHQQRQHRHQNKFGNPLTRPATTVSSSAPAPGPVQSESAPSAQPTPASQSVEVQYSAPPPIETTPVEPRPEAEAAITGVSAAEAFLGTQSDAPPAVEPVAPETVGGGTEISVAAPESAPVAAPAPVQREQRERHQPPPRPPVRKVVLLNSNEPGEIRVAILENGELAEIFMERKSRSQQAGNVYKGRVVNVEPSLQAAFIDLGTERNGFLHASDVIPPDGGYSDIAQRAPGRHDRPNGQPQQQQQGGTATEAVAAPAAVASESSNVLAATVAAGSGNQGVTPILPQTGQQGQGQFGQGQGQGGRRRRRRRGGRGRSGRGRPPMGAPMLAPAPAAGQAPAPSSEGQVLTGAPTQGTPEALPPADPPPPDGQQVTPPSPDALAARPDISASGFTAVGSGIIPPEPEKANASPTLDDISEEIESSQDAAADTEDVDAEDDVDSEDGDDAEDDAGDEQAVPIAEAPQEPGAPAAERPAEPDAAAAESSEQPAAVSETSETPQEPEPEAVAPATSNGEPMPEKSRDHDHAPTTVGVVAPSTVGASEPAPANGEQMPDLSAFVGEGADIHAEAIPQERAIATTPPISAIEEAAEAVADEEDEDEEEEKQPDETAGAPRPAVPGQRRPSQRFQRKGGGGRSGRDRSDRRYTIQEMLREGQEVLVQVAKEGIGQKGPALTTYLSMPGRYMVLMPAVQRLGVSKRIENEEQRRALKDALNQLNPPDGMGVIVRTAGMGKTKDELQRDMDYLMRIWDTLKKKARMVKAPALIYQEGDVVTRVFRDVITDDVSEIIIDDQVTMERAREFLRETSPGSEHKLKLYTDAEPLFHKLGVEQQMQRLFNRKVNLRNGGSIVIEQTEALVAIDVNTGRFREKRNQDDTILQANLEAAREIARQLRLRDIGGLVMIDFIDMEIGEHRRRVERELKAHLARDKARINVLPISTLGVVEMTRQRIRHSLKKTLFDRCPSCSGSGHIKSPESVGLEMLREIKSQLKDVNVRRVKVLLHSQAAFAILNQFRKDLVRLEEARGVSIEVCGDPSVPLSQIQVSTAREGGDWVLKKVSEVDDYVRNT